MEEEEAEEVKEEEEVEGVTTDAQLLPLPLSRRLARN